MPKKPVSEQARRARLEQADRDLKSLAEATAKLRESRTSGSFARLAEFVDRPLVRPKYLNVRGRK